MLEVLVAALWWFSGGVSEGFVDLVHIERVEEGGMGFLVGGGGDGRHYVGGCSLGVVLLVAYAVDSEISRLYARHHAPRLSHARELGTRVAQCVRKCVRFPQTNDERQLLLEFANGVDSIPHR